MATLPKGNSPTIRGTIDPKTNNVTLDGAALERHFRKQQQSGMKTGGSSSKAAPLNKSNARNKPAAASS